MKTLNERRFYVYAYLRADGTPYYIGKGTGRRAWRHNKGDRVPAPASEFVQILLDSLTSAEALSAEVDLIALLGVKKDGGCLVNWTEGGDGLSNPSDEVRAKMSAWVRTDEMRAKLRKSKTAHHAAEANSYGVSIDTYSGMSKRNRHKLKAFVAKYPELTFMQALEMGAKGRTHYAASRPCALARRSATRKSTGVESKIAKATRARAPIYRWQHPDHGVVECPVWELASRFAGQSLTRPNLAHVASGRRRSCKGWTLAA